MGKFRQLPSPALPPRRGGLGGAQGGGGLHGGGASVQAAGCVHEHHPVHATNRDAYC